MNTNWFKELFIDDVKGCLGSRGGQAPTTPTIEDPYYLFDRTYTWGSTWQAAEEDMPILHAIYSFLVSEPVNPRAFSTYRLNLDTGMSLTATSVDTGDIGVGDETGKRIKFCTYIGHADLDEYACGYVKYDSLSGKYSVDTFMFSGQDVLSMFTQMTGTVRIQLVVPYSVVEDLL